MLRIFLETRNKGNSVSFVLFYASELMFREIGSRGMTACKSLWCKISPPEKCEK